MRRNKYGDYADNPLSLDPSPTKGEGSLSPTPLVGGVGERGPR